jgi:16S rRNA G966 N2-methylase RsmD
MRIADHNTVDVVPKVLFTMQFYFSVRLFEYDNRFDKFGSDFTFYDYKSPLDVPRDLRESFDLVFADPPFLSEECLTKTAVTVKFLAKDKIVLCTGK